jgi:hypothetical protein
VRRRQSAFTSISSYHSGQQAKGTKRPLSLSLKEYPYFLSDDSKGIIITTTVLLVSLGYAHLHVLPRAFINSFGSFCQAPATTSESHPLPSARRASYHAPTHCSLSGLNPRRLLSQTDLEQREDLMCQA